MTGKKIPPVHPGETLLEEFLKPMGISLSQIAGATNIPETAVREITEGKKSVTAETALRLGKYFGMSPHFWMGLQNHYDLAVAEDRFEHGYEQSYAA